MWSKLEEIWWKIMGVVGYAFMTISVVGLVVVMVWLLGCCLIGVE